MNEMMERNNKLVKKAKSCAKVFKNCTKGIFMCKNWRKISLFENF